MVTLTRKCEWLWVNVENVWHADNELQMALVET